VLKAIEIEGFKSFGSPPQRVRLSPLCFLVGPNASGKSNFLSALRFLQNTLRHDVEFAVNELGGVSEVRHKGQRKREQEKNLRVCVELDEVVPLEGAGSPLRLRDFRYQIEIDLRRKDRRPIIVNESLRAEINDPKAGARMYRLTRDEKSVQICDPRAESVIATEFGVPPQESSRPAVAAGFFSLPTVVFRKCVERWGFYNISPHVARQSHREAPGIALGPLGENLAVVLHNIQERNGDGGLEGIVAGLRGAVPGLAKVAPVKIEIEGRWALTIEEEKIRGKISPESISDGTVRLLALMVIAHQGVKDSGLIAIEEPENGLHPHLSGHVVNVLRETSGKTQVIATTHNPAFLDHLEPSELLLCGKSGGFTRIQQADSLAEIAAFRKHFSLGDLWVQGTFDGLFEC
jgi:predicted ATPase